MPSTTEESAENLAELADTLSVPDGWTVTHKTPSPHITSNNGPERVEITREDRFDRDDQSHDELPVTGIKVTIRADTHRDLYETVCTPMLNTAEFSGKRLVISKLTEATEWAHRMIAAVENTPAGWVILPTDSLEMNRWMTLDGRHEIQVWQDDRDNFEPRKYRVIQRESNEYRSDERTTHREDLNTDDLYDTVMNVLAETYVPKSNSIQNPPRMA
jgi:hypothetical protein